MGEPAESNVHKMPSRLTTDAGGATVDTSRIAGLRFAAGTRDLERQFKKGDDVVLEVVCRVTGAGCDDKYDAHGNIAETIRGHKLRIDDVVRCDLLQAGAARTASEAEAQAERDEREAAGQTTIDDAAVDERTAELAERMAGSPPADDAGDGDFPDD